MAQTEQTKSTLFVVTTFQGKSKIESYWKECFFSDDFSEWNVKIIDGQVIPHESHFWADNYYKSAQNRLLIDLFARNKVKSGDVFVFTEAFNYLVVPLTTFRYEFNLDIRFVGFWSNSVFNYQTKTGKWGKEFFFSIFNAYDLNCFPTEQHLNIFNWRFSMYVSRRSEYVVSGFPFEYLYDNYDPVSLRDDVVVFPWAIKDEIQQKVFRGFKDELPDCEFVLAQETYNQRSLYKSLLNRSKCLFWGGDVIDDPVMIFEAMCNGVIPIIPERTFLYFDFPSKYYYPKSMVEPRLSNNKELIVIRHRLQLVDIIRDRIKNYDDLKDKVRSDALVMKHLYRNDIVKEKLKK